jgi:hypothetical protein
MKRAIRTAVFSCHSGSHLCCYNCLNSSGLKCWPTFRSVPLGAWVRFPPEEFTFVFQQLPTSCATYGFTLIKSGSLLSALQMTTNVTGYFEIFEIILQEHKSKQIFWSGIFKCRECQVQIWIIKCIWTKWNDFFLANRKQIKIFLILPNAAPSVIFCAPLNSILLRRPN